MTLRVGLVAGESSGDLLGAGLISAVRQRIPDAVFEGVAGPEMIAAGCERWADAEELAVMGVVEPLRHLVRNAVAHGIEPPEARERAGKPAAGTVEVVATDVISVGDLDTWRRTDRRHAALGQPAVLVTPDPAAAPTTPRKVSRAVSRSTGKRPLR